MRISWDSVCTYAVELHTDTIEFSPDGLTALCGAYELDEKSGTRFGSLYLYKRLNGDNFTLHTSAKCAGILDISWVDNECAITALSDGRLGLWCIRAHDLCGYYTQETESIVLSVEMFNGKIVSSDTNGTVRLWNISGSSLLAINSFQAHDAEAWCVAWDRLGQHIVFSGADDGNCCVWDARTCEKPVFTIKHEAGVCSIRNHPTIVNRISTGSYDDSFRIWDLRMLYSANLGELPEPLLACPIGGGVWRHKWGPDGRVLMAAMHAGFAIVGPFNERASPCSVPIHRYRTSAQLAYGVDWTSLCSEPSQLNWTVATCSFYDNTIDFSRLMVSSDA